MGAAKGDLRGAAAYDENNTKASFLQGAGANITSESTTGVFAYQQNAHTNCYEGHGGAWHGAGPADGYQQDVHSVEDCGSTCHGNQDCSCFVYFRKYDQCFLRSECDLPACEPGVDGEESYMFDTYTEGPVGAPCYCEHGQGRYGEYSPPSNVACFCESCDPGYMMTDMACVPIPSTKHDHLNCYAGHGGTPVGSDEPQQGVHDVDNCKTACLQTDGCECFVFFSKYDNQCFLRSHCELSECEAGAPGQESYLFDTWIMGY